MFTREVRRGYQSILREIRESGLWKEERVLEGPQYTRVSTREQKEIINLCANNYLGLANHPRVVAAARSSYDNWGYGVASVRFICGTQLIHKKLEENLSSFFGMDEAILYASCFDANTGLFETLFGPDDVVFSDELNHASIIDGLRLCKAKKVVYRNNDADDLEQKLKAYRGSGLCMIATDGVFSMDGIIANLGNVCDLAETYGAMVMVDDSHAAGFLGKTGRGTPEYRGVKERVDIITGTLGKAMGGGSGGYTCGPKEIIELLRQRSRPYLFSNSLTPAIAVASSEVITMLTETTEYRDLLEENTRYFREKMSAIGFEIIPGDHPIVPVMLHDAHLSQEVSAYLLERGIYAVGFFYPVVPKGKARIRMQLSAAHEREDLDRALQAYALAYEKFMN